MLTVRSTINIAGQTVPQIIPVVQGDTGRAILFTLADFTIPAGATATYYVQKPSGEAVYNNATIDGNNVLVELTAQSIIEKGDNYGQVRITVGEEVVTSFDFILLVKEFRGIDAVQSLTEMNIFDKAVEQASEAIDEVKTDALEAIDDAKDEAIEEVTSNFDLKLDASSTKGVQNQVITQAINTVNNAIGDLSGETVTPTATNNYGVGGNVGQVIETWATTEYWHGIYTVSAGNTYGITTVSDFPQQIVVWFTNSSNVILEIHKAFATDHVEMVCTAPTGATKLFVMSYGYDAYHGTVQKVEPLSETVSNLKDDFGQDNNLFNGVFANGYWHDKTMSTTDQYTPFQSIKIDYLPKGDYKITFENEIRVIRKVICEQIFSTGYNVSAKTPFYFNVPYDNAPLGFSFAGRSSGTSVPYSGYIIIESSGETLSTDKLTARDVISEKDIARLKDVTAILDNVQISKTDDFVSGAIGASSIYERNDRQCTITYYPVEKGDMVLFNPPKTGQTFGFSVARYTEPKYSGYINTIAWLYNDYGNSEMPRTPYVVTDEKYVRFTISEGNNADLSGISFGDVFYILRHGTRTMQKYNLMHGENDPISGKKPIRYTGGGSLNMGQDGTFVDGKLWCFGDGVTSGSITILDVDTDTIIGTKTHNLGHANTVDYNVNNKTLAMFYTESHKPHILLYKNPADAVSLLKTDANCMIIPLYNDNTQLSSSGGLCWGENDNVIYFMDGVYSHYEGKTGIVADEINITKILLGRGDNDLSADGFGTFVSGKAENEYNGTCAIIKQFKGSMKDPMAWTVISGGSPVHLGLQTIQGMEYDGYLYIGWGTSGHNFLRIQLDDTKDTYSVDYCYRYLYTNYKNAPSYYEPELCALTSDRVFCGSTGNNLLSFTR